MPTIEDDQQEQLCKMDERTGEDLGKLARCAPSRMTPEQVANLRLPEGCAIRMDCGEWCWKATLKISPNEAALLDVASHVANGLLHPSVLDVAWDSMVVPNREELFEQFARMSRLEQMEKRCDLLRETLDWYDDGKPGSAAYDAIELDNELCVRQLKQDDDLQTIERWARVPNKARLIKRYWHSDALEYVELQQDRYMVMYGSLDRCAKWVRGQEAKGS